MSLALEIVWTAGTSLLPATVLASLFHNSLHRKPVGILAAKIRAPVSRDGEHKVYINADGRAKYEDVREVVCSTAR